MSETSRNGNSRAGRLLRGGQAVSHLWLRMPKAALRLSPVLLLAAAALVALGVFFVHDARSAQAQGGEPPALATLRCIAGEGVVGFFWAVSQWSGGEVDSYDYELRLPDGKTEEARTKSTYILRWGEYQPGKEARLSIKTNYETAGGRTVSSAAELLVCNVGGPRSLVISPGDTTRVYGGTDAMSYTVSGLVDGDTASNVVSGSLGRASGDDVGSYAINLGTLAVAPTYAHKYALPSGPTIATYAITPRAITVISGVTVNARLPDGITTATFDTGSAQGAGVVPAELADFQAGGLAVSGSFPSTEIGSYDLSVTYSLQDHGSFKAGNYTLSQSAAATLRGEILSEQAQRPTPTPTPTPTTTPSTSGTCQTSGVSPVAVTVSAVPIVVTSTTADYFVLYVRPDLDADFEIPVSVTLGQDGATTLTEQLATLPKAHYRVEKYQVANLGDVDGDCIDDITELQDLGTQNPVNPVKAIDITSGAVAIPDHETFERLAYQGAMYMPDPHLADQAFVKFYFFDTDRPMVYFMNTKIHQMHLFFLRALPSDALHPGQNTWADQTFWEVANKGMGGDIVYLPNAVAPDGSLGVYRFTFQSYDNYSFDEIANANEALAASMPFLENNLAYHPLSWALPRYQSEKALYDASRVNVLLEEDIFPDVDFISLNQGEGYGFLRTMSPEERPNPRDIVIYETLPNNLPRVAGIITTVPQTPLSHVNLRAVQDNIPNAFIRDALDDSSIDDLLDRHVRYQVTQSGYTLRAATRAEVDAHYESSRPAEAQTPERDLSVTKTTALGDVEFDDWDAFGVKAANVAVLGTLNFPEGTVPDGFAVPFYFYDEFMKNAVLAEETLFGKKKWDDDDKFTMPAGTKLSAVVTAMLAHRKFQTDYDIQEEMLDDLRDAIKDAESPQWIIDALTTKHATYPEGQSLRYRSSTNNEDLPGFSGAGLYGSKTQDPDETAEDGIDKSIKGVWASLWNFRAFVERDFHRVDHTKTAMGVLVHPNYTDEPVNGVAVSFDPFSGREGAYYVNTQVGEDLVTNPEAHSRPEEILLLPDGSYDVLAYSNQKEPRGLLMSNAQMKQLRKHLTVIHDRFKALYQPAPSEPFAMEIEFKITSANKLAIKQARPWVFAGREVPLAGSKYAGLIAKMKEWRNDPCCVSDQTHTDRWDRTLLAFGETVSDTTLTPMTADEAQGYADRGWEGWVEVVAALREIEAAGQQPGTPNQAPTVSAAIADATIVNESGTQTVSLSGVFSDADNDALTITAASSDEAVATISVAPDQSSLTLTAQARGTVIITVTADDGNEGTVSDTFTVSVKAAPTVASAIGEVSRLEVGATQEVSLSGVFSDADGDTLTTTASSSDDATATVTVAADQSKLTLSGVAEGTATITVTAQDADGNRVSDAFEAPVAKRYASLIARMYQWRNDPCCVSDRAHTDRWDRTLLTFGETVADTTLLPMRADEAQTYADRGWTRWVEVTAALRELETADQQQQQATPHQPPTVSAAIADTTIASESGMQTVSLSGVFSDADGDSLTITAMSSDDAIATASVASDGSALTLTGVAEGTATITVTAQDADGNSVRDTFDAPVAKRYASLIAKMKEWRNDPCCASNQAHTDRWDRTLLAFGETVADTTLSAMTADEAQGYADRGWTRWVEVTAALREIEAAGQQQQGTLNQAPTVSAAIADATIVNESSTKQVSLSGVFSDADNDSLIITAGSSAETVATVSVASDYSTLTVSAKARGTATITVTADDGNGGTVSDTFTVTVKAAPTVASGLADVSGLEVGTTQELSLSGVFSDADGDALTITAQSSDDATATVTVASDRSRLTVAGVAQGTATITVTARDADGNTVSDSFDVSVAEAGSEAEEDHGEPPAVTNLRCKANTNRVLFRWDVPEWSGGEIQAYDYQLNLPDGGSKSSRSAGVPLLYQAGEYQAGGEASASVKAVYGLPDGSHVSSAAATLTCTVEE